MKVFILTRFAIRPDKELSIFPKATQTPRYLQRSWLEARLERMANFTIPSLKAQTDIDFDWLVGLDNAVPMGIQAPLARLIPKFANIVQTLTRLHSTKLSLNS